MAYGFVTLSWYSTGPMQSSTQYYSEGISALQMILGKVPSATGGIDSLSVVYVPNGFSLLLIIPATVTLVTLLSMSVLIADGSEAVRIYWIISLVAGIFDMLLLVSRLGALGSGYWLSLLVPSLLLYRLYWV